MLDINFESSTASRVNPEKLVSDNISNASTAMNAASNNDAVNMLLAKLDEGTQTVVNLRSILTMKTAELNELLAQLELTNQAITTVEATTTQIENMLKDFGFDQSKENLLLSAEATLDSAIKSAASIYPQNLMRPSTNNFRRASSISTHSGSAGIQDGGEGELKRISSARFSTTRIRYKPDTKHILRKLNDLLRDLHMDSGKFFASIGTTDDYEQLQKAYVDLDIAKTISLSAKSNLRRRNILLRSARRRNNKEEIEALDERIREGVSLWRIYTRNSPLMINGEEIITILDREDDLLERNLPIPSSRYTHTPLALTPSTSSNTRRASIRSSITPDNFETSSHSRTSSTVSNRDFNHVQAGQKAIHSPTVVSFNLPTVTSSMGTKGPATATINSAKKTIYRQSAGPRLTQVKANVGLPRVRTTSFTQQQKDHHQHQKSSSPVSVTTTTTNTANSVNKDIPTSSTFVKTPTSSNMSRRQSHIPLPSHASNTADKLPPPTVNNDAKRNTLKAPSQRGPGSTLRLRSMLAKRGQLPPTAAKPSVNFATST
ncbi:hypothetical protein BDF20DRAFT_841073 [Mycotypha africana]|uniref:uncharacterized protein n=1 Tax=Mycotypha africana TaxID=64632 RepID=UPI0023000CD8|nr:uncharacterized protein BDF20DRAFT_841073 [Mycotypha africana]KAI8990828.1 hypothetical protein BDF20DRAFT_841073 [Mycotypha africana]